MKELNNFRKFLTEEEADKKIHEGTWSLGSVERMEKLITVLTALSQNDNLGLIKAQLEKLDNSLYRVFGDDDFSDKKDAAMRHLEDGDLDRFRNSMGDAIDRAKDMLAYQKSSENLEENDSTLDESFIGDLATRIRKRKAAKKEKERFTKGLDMEMGDTPKVDPEFTKGLEENDAVLDEVIEEATIFDRIDQMIDTIADQMSPDDAFKALAAEFQVVSGGTMMLERALRRMIEDLGLTGDVREEEADKQIHEGTWSLGSVERMETLIAALTAISQNDNLGLMKAQLEKLDNSLYRVFGDDDFSDSKDAAMRHLEDGDLDRFRNSMGDAIDRAKDMLAYQKSSENLEENDSTLDESFIGDLATRIRKRKAAKKEKERFTKGLDMEMGDTPKVDPEFTKGLEENDAVLDEVIEEATIFDRIDQMIDTIADQMSPDDAFKALAAEFQVVSGGTMMLERALRRMIEDLGLTGDVREEEVEEIRSAYNEEKEEK